MALLFGSSTLYSGRCASGLSLVGCVAPLMLRRQLNQPRQLIQVGCAGERRHGPGAQCARSGVLRDVRASPLAVRSRGLSSCCRATSATGRPCAAAAACRTPRTPMGLSPSRPLQTLPPSPLRCQVGRRVVRPHGQTKRHATAWCGVCPLRPWSAGPASRGAQRGARAQRAHKEAPNGD